MRNEDLCTPLRTDAAAGARLKHGLKVEPLVLRVAAGDVVQVTLHQRGLDATQTTFTTPISGARPGVPYSNPFGPYQRSTLRRMSGCIRSCWRST